MRTVLMYYTSYLFGVIAFKSMMILTHNEDNPSA